ncbi:MAG: hypothetical protein H6621_03590 [Halobacteriovoraceae bacterium]|nr:hypothetical protein [Halobacteriovoraceae bacterium]MCB9094131.1 hypothetical protein [Halobacteriovoraceae bacterium]
MFKFVFTIITLFFSLQSLAQPKIKWEATVPSSARNFERWHDLVDSLYKERMYFGVLAASYRMLLYFDDIETKKKSFQYLVNLIDLGYPHSLNHIFFFGDLDLVEQSDFAQSYNFYKAVVNKMKKMVKWSDDFFSRIDKENFKKYLFYKAINLYKDKKLQDAANILDEILKQPLLEKDFTFVKKVVRTKARIHFEQKQFDLSLGYYDDFLLKVNPVTPTDWLEKAWNLFYLKRYDEALGALYNLEAPSLKKYPSFEKYILRSSIYLNNCATENVNTLIKNFEDEFEYSITGIIKGKQLGKLRQIIELAKNTHPQYKAVIDAIGKLKEEYKIIDTLPSELQSTAKFLYKSELRSLIRFSRVYKEKAINKAAEDLTMLAESLKFLGYSTAREKYNPITVFIPRENENKNLIEVIDYEKRGFVFRWMQLGNYWRDERNKYFGEMKNKCD